MLLDRAEARSVFELDRWKLHPSGIIDMFIILYDCFAVPGAFIVRFSSEPLITIVDIFNSPEFS